MNTKVFIFIIKGYVSNLLPPYIYTYDTCLLCEYLCKVYLSIESYRKQITIVAFYNWWSVSPFIFLRYGPLWKTALSHFTKGLKITQETYLIHLASQPGLCCKPVGIDNILNIIYIVYLASEPDLYPFPLKIKMSQNLTNPSELVYLITLFCMLIFWWYV